AGAGARSLSSPTRTREGSSLRG
ncbi:GHMP kinase, N-terminal domain-containing protein, partial [Toxoplasma gondii RUB]